MAQLLAFKLASCCSTSFVTMLMALAVDDLHKYPVESLRYLGNICIKRFPLGSRRLGQNQARMLGALPYLEEEAVVLSDPKPGAVNGVEMILET
jgi:hypothetical protein